MSAEARESLSAPRGMPRRTKAKHGTTTMHSYGCRCADCKTAIRDYQAARRRRLGMLTREEWLAELAARPFPHGTVNGYSNRGCRCAECRKAWNEHVRDYYARKLARPVPLPEHGTESRYTSPRDPCRCEACKKASADARRERRRAMVAA